jgi:hypothetical protein
VTPGTAEIDFFISYAHHDRAWAQWIAAELNRAEHRVVIDVWSWPAGSEFVSRMSEALRTARCVVIVLSPASFRPDSLVDAEISAAFLRAKQENCRLLPVRIEDCEIPPLLASYSHVDLVGCDEPTASRRLLDAVGDPEIPSSSPFPGRAGPPPVAPDPDARISNLPPRNGAFTGRAKLLAQIRRELTADLAGRPVTLHGLAGVGKTQATIEYAHQYADDYDIVWWVAADQSPIVAEQIATLAGPLGISAKDPLPGVSAAIVDLLSHRTRWLLIFDDVQQPVDVRPFLPGGTGHVLITSQQRGWGSLAKQIEVDVFSRRESIGLLRTRLEVPPPLANRLATELGDLPLAVEQAAAYLDSTGIPPEEYVVSLRERAGTLAFGEVLGYHHTVATVWSLLLERLESESPAALQILEILAFFGPEPVPLDVFTGNFSLLPEPLADAAAVPFDFSRTVGTVVHHSLGRRRGDRLEVHRLLQAAIRSQLPAGRADEVASIARGLLVGSCPAADGPETWARWTQLSTHLLAAPAMASPGVGGAARTAQLSAGRYLYIRGDYRAARDFSLAQRERWTAELGDNHPDVLSAGKNLASPLVGLGEYDRAATIHRDVYERRRKALGENDIRTLNSASDLADTLRLDGRFEESYALNVQIHVAFAEAHGIADRDTLRCANNLANDLYGLKRFEQARQLDEQTHAARAETLGPEHPDTLVTAANLAADLFALGLVTEARELMQSTYNAFLTVVGPNHPDVLATANNLAVALTENEGADAGRARQQETCQRFRRVLGESHPLTAVAEANLRPGPGVMIRV